MCIRDRNNRRSFHLPPNHKFLQKLVRLISNKVPEVVPENAKMDLYWVRTSEEPAVFIVVELGSVSYTHLDVYKRQT